MKLEEMHGPMVMSARTADCRIPSWDEFFIRLSRFVALKSKDPSRGVGVVFVGEDHEVLSVGFNGFPRGIKDDPGEVPERYERPAKYGWTVHGETNACLNAARAGIRLRGCTAYMESLPGTGCAHYMIQAGVAEVVACPMDPRFDQFAGDPTWDDDRRRAVQHLREAGVSVRTVEVRRILAEV